MATPQIKIRRYIGHLAECINWLNRLRDSNNETWLPNAEKEFEILCDLLPSGSGFDAGWEVQDKITEDGNIIINGSYHHMDEHGYYSHWSDFFVIVSPSFNGCGFDFEYGGDPVDDDDFEQYLDDVVQNMLSQVYERLSYGIDIRYTAIEASFQKVSEIA